jgi:SGNH domain (fused to AT3 domains)/Bacterial TSP3 repeat
VFQLGQGSAIVGRRRSPAGAISAFAVPGLVAILALALPVGAASRVHVSIDTDGDGLTDVFEQTRSHTDPLLVDTDGDGVPDGAEDPDADGLANLWEQRLGLDPLKADTDGDGVRDGSEDADADQLTNAFEIRYGVTDPTRNDTDGDGLRDVAEDPDGDGLSNFGEQRFGTSPRLADTDRDGISDSREDANHNGISNGLEQDRRKVPLHLVPSLARAWGDRGPNYHDGCHTGTGPAIHPCVYGDPDGTVTIVLFGDSHAAQWLPALIAAARTRPWRIVALTHSGCPSVQVNAGQKSTSAATACRTWRQRAVAWLRNHPPDVVLLSNFGGYSLTDSQGHRIPTAGREAAWQQGLTRTLNQMPDSASLLVLDDTASTRVDVPVCLKTHPNQISACETPRSQAIHRQHTRAEKAAAKQTGATFASMNGVVCSYDPCPVVVNELLMWRDRGHLTATYATQLAPSLAARVERVLAP